jgi:hypothetical protein
VHTRDWSTPVQIALSRLLQLAIALALAGALWRQQWLVAFTALVVLGITFLPALIEHRLSVHLPVEFTLMTPCFYTRASAWARCAVSMGVSGGGTSCCTASRRWSWD